MTYIIAEPCIDLKDKSCIDVCPVDCIHEVGRMLVIDPEECIDCGACEPECPVEAIFPEDALPDKWEPFVKINYAYPDSAAIDQLVDRSSATGAQRAGRAARLSRPVSDRDLRRCSRQVLAGDRLRSAASSSAGVDRLSSIGPRRVRAACLRVLHLRGRP